MVYVIKTYFGDANLDGVFDSSDLAMVFAGGHYNDSIANNSAWEDGDWNGDGEFDTGDYVAAIAAGGYNLAQQEGFNDPAVELQFGFTGRLFDEDTGLQNNLHRWYDSKVGRWLSKDPIGFAAGDANLYRYVGNEVTGVVDPSGLVGKGPSLSGIIFLLDFPGHFRYFRTGSRERPKPVRVGRKPPGTVFYSRSVHVERKWAGDPGVTFVRCSDGQGNHWHENSKGQEGVYDPWDHFFRVDGEIYPVEPSSGDLMMQGAGVIVGGSVLTRRTPHVVPNPGATGSRRVTQFYDPSKGSFPVDGRYALSSQPSLGNRIVDGITETTTFVAPQPASRMGQFRRLMTGVGTRKNYVEFDVCPGELVSPSGTKRLLSPFQQTISGKVDLIGRNATYGVKGTNYLDYGFRYTVGAGVAGGGAYLTYDWLYGDE